MINRADIASCGLFRVSCQGKETRQPYYPKTGELLYRSKMPYVKDIFAMTTFRASRPELAPPSPPPRGQELVPPRSGMSAPSARASPPFFRPSAFTNTINGRMRLRRHNQSGDAPMPLRLFRQPHQQRPSLKKPLHPPHNAPPPHHVAQTMPHNASGGHTVNVHQGEHGHRVKEAQKPAGK